MQYKAGHSSIFFVKKKRRRRSSDTISVSEMYTSFLIYLISHRQLDICQSKIPSQTSSPNVSTVLLFVKQTYAFISQTPNVVLFVRLSVRIITYCNCQLKSSI